MAASKKPTALDSALAIVRKEKDARRDKFTAEIKALCRKHKVNISEMKMEVLDWDTELTED